MLVALEAGEVLGQLAEETDAFAEADVRTPAYEGLALGGKPMAENFAWRFARGSRGDTILEGDFAGSLKVEPFAVAAVDAPVGKVLFRDGVEARSEDGADFGMGVEPGDEGFAEGTVAEAVVEFFADGEWETSDFSEARHVEFRI